MKFASNRLMTLAGVIALTLLLSAPMTYGAGFSIFEQGARAMGRAGAFTATADDPSAIFFNPAGLAFQHGFNVYLGGTFITPNVDFTGANPFPGDGVTESLKSTVFFPPNVYITYDLLDGITLGLGIFADFGLTTEWDNPATFSGRYISTKASLVSFTINPAIGFKVSDQLALGVGLNIRTTDVELNRFVPIFDPFTFKVVDAARVKLESDTQIDFGFNAGLLYKVTDKLRFGFSYRHHINSELEGKASFTILSTGNPQLDAAIAATLPSTPIPVRTGINYPKVISIGVAADPWETWSFEVNVNWMEWSRFEELKLDFPENPEFNQTLVQEWDDVFSIRFGVEKVLNDRWTIRGGFIFDDTPQPPRTMSPILPDADRYSVIVGTTINFGNWYVDVAEMLLFFKDRSTSPDNERGYFGEYSNFTNLVGINLGIRF